LDLMLREPDRLSFCRLVIKPGIESKRNETKRNRTKLTLLTQSVREVNKQASHLSTGQESLAWPDRYFLLGGVYRLEIAKLHS